MSDPRAQFPDLTKPDADVRQAALARQNTLTKPPGSLGRLEELSVWVSACQGHCPPKQFERDRKSTRLNSSHYGRSRMPSSA